MTNLWGIDLGGTKIEGVVINPEAIDKPLCRLRVDTEKEGGYQHIISQIQKLVQMMSAELSQKPSAIGFGTPGTLDPKTQLLKNSNTLCLNDMPLHKDLSEALKVKVKMANDANCFALAEALLGAGKGAHCVFGVIIGTGVGGGVVIDGKVLTGCQGIAGEWGHNVLKHDGEACYCNKAGCVESVISGPALEKYYTSLSGQNISLSEICALHTKDTDDHAIKTMERLVEYFGRAISVVINILDPDIVVLGGGLSNIDILYSDGVAAVNKSIFNNCVNTQIRKNQLGDSAGVFGAAMLTC